ncbi:hypothetical protein RND81_02G235900 [Saponaria officinalis]|uniref:Uncharacterized protein n=1 Tax=Saponaria officinalis TaxID=3572 RepID=A0AAW1MZU9_SAPOF
MPHSRGHTRPALSPLRRLMQRRRRRVVVERKLRRLQRMIPGGHEGMHSDRLFILTAHYIMHLRLQLNLLHALSKIYLPHF